MPTDQGLQRVSVWFDGALKEDRRGQISGALSDAGIEPLEGPADGVAGVFFAAVDDRVLAAVARLATAAPERIVAVEAGDSPLDDRDAWRLLSAGAADVVRWNGADGVAEALAARLERWVAIDALLASPRVAGTLIGRSSAWTQALREVIEVACFSDSDVLLTGESGTGKELVAHLIDELDPRPERGPFVTLDCTTVVPTLVRQRVLRARARSVHRSGRRS